MPPRAPSSVDVNLDIDTGGPMRSLASRRSRRGRKPKSCVPCRLRKVKCNRVFPCMNCAQRGLAEFCPGGYGNETSLPGLVRRIASLEGGGENPASSSSSHRVPPQDRSTNGNPTDGVSHASWQPASQSVESHAAEETGVPSTGQVSHGTRAEAELGEGTLFQRESGSAIFLGASAASILFEQLIEIVGDQPNPGANRQPNLSPPLGAPTTVHGSIHRSSAFTPPHNVASECLDSYLRYISWLHRPARTAEIETLFTAYYGGPLDGQVDTHEPTGDRSNSLNDLELSLLLGALALGAQACPHRCDAKRRNVVCEDYPDLGRDIFQASESLLSRSGAWKNPSILGCKTLYLHASYLLGVGTVLEAHEAWMVLGVLARASQAIGLHINPASWGLPVNLIKDRQNLFWEAFSFDAQISLIFGRPPTSFIAPSSCERLPYVDKPDMFFWFKHRLSEVTAAIAQDAFLTGKQTYSTVQRLDAQLKEVESSLPQQLQWQVAIKPRQETDEQRVWATNHLLLQSLQLAALLHKTTISLHQPWVHLVLKQGLSEPENSLFGGSFKRCIEAAQGMAQVMQSLILYCPHEASLEWSFPSAAITAAALLSACIVGAPRSTLTAGLWRDLRLLIDAISATPLNGISKKASKLLQRFSEASQRAMGRARSSWSMATLDQTVAASGPVDTPASPHPAVLVRESSIILEKGVQNPAPGIEGIWGTSRGDGAQTNPQSAGAALGSTTEWIYDGPRSEGDPYVSSMLPAFGVSTINSAPLLDAVSDPPWSQMALDFETRGRPASTGYQTTETPDDQVSSVNQQDADWLDSLFSGVWIPPQAQ